VPGTGPYRALKTVDASLGPARQRQRRPHVPRGEVGLCSDPRWKFESKGFDALRELVQAGSTAEFRRQRCRSFARRAQGSA